jgi:demethoxyubiquinone hydroxylase (CLK1/Coq7/Cat5 family)
MRPDIAYPFTPLLGPPVSFLWTRCLRTSRSQLKELAEMPQTHPSIPLLQNIVREFRDDELGHLDTAVSHHSQRAPAHALLSTIVGAGCKVAIELCKRV